MKGKIGILFVVAIMALASVGASYAIWSGDVAMNVSSTTGNFDFQIESVTVVDDGGADIDVQWTAGQQYYEVDITVTDTYPGWIGYIDVTHKNAGTVDLKFDSFQVQNLVGSGALKDGYTIKFYPPGEDDPNIWGTLRQFTTKQKYSWWINPEHTRISPGDTHTSRVSLELDEDITGHYNEEITFTFRMWAVQA